MERQQESERRAVAMVEKRHSEWWCWWTESRKKIPSAVPLVVAGLLIYACLVVVRRSTPKPIVAAQVASSSSTRLAVSDAPPTGLEHIVFVIAGSARSWPTRQNYVRLWWHPCAAKRGFVWLDRPLPGNASVDDDSLPPLRISSPRPPGVNGLESGIRISRLVLETIRLGLPNVRWFVMGDDDTIFFPKNLAMVLRKYDHNRFFYIGHGSESQKQSSYHSFTMAFGGGGFAISYPLAQALDKMQDQCLRRYPRIYGSDGRIEACTAELGVPLTREQGFHQIDLRGNIFGFLAAHPVTPLISLHHLDAVAPIFPNQNRLQALRHLMRSIVVDSEGVLQQSICYDTHRNVTFSISWGYAVQVFAGMLTPIQLQKPIATFLDWKAWRDNSELFTFGVQPLAKDSCQNPSVFFMQTMQQELGSDFVAIYTRNDLWRNKSCPKLINPDKIRVSKEHQNDSWLLAPRRQCCEVVRSSFPLIDSYAGVLHARVRDCKLDEIIAPRP